MRQGLVDTTTVGGGAAIAASAWKVDGIIEVSRKIKGTQAAAAGTYPFTETEHPKYNKYIHNAIGNVFEITHWLLENPDANGANRDVVLRDIYWEPSEFMNSSGVPDIVLLFNNYGATYGNQTEPKAYRLWKNEGVTGVYDRAQTGALPKLRQPKTTRTWLLSISGPGPGSTA